MGPTQSLYILQLCMSPSYFCRGLTLHDPPLFRTLVIWSPHLRYNIQSIERVQRRFSKRLPGLTHNVVMYNMGP